MTRFAIASAVSLFALAAASTASAQQQPDVPAEPSAPAQSEEADIIVTGSRIARSGFEAPTPVTAVGTDELAQSAPGAIADGLNQLPQFQNSTTTSARSTGNAGSQNTGNYLNMRALGTNRVLVLQDGQRMPVSGNNGGVDVSLVPSMLIERVEVVTGGASAVYGSDAVSGVVNFILDKRMTGVRVLAQGGIGTDGHIPSYRFGVAGGVALLDDRLHIVGSAERYYTGPLHRRYFPIMAEGWTVNGQGTAANPFVNINNTRSTTLSSQGIIVAGPLAGQFNSSGAIVPFNAGTPTNIAGVSIGGDGGYFDQQNGTTGSSQLMNQFFVRPEFDFGGGTVGFVSVGYNTSEYLSNPGGGFIRQIRIFNDNAFLTPSQRTTLGATPSFDVGRIFTDGPMHDIVQTSDSLVINAGLRGEFSGRFKWDIGYSHAWTKFTSSQNDIEFSKFYAATDAVTGPSGNIVCRVTLDPNPAIASRYQGCVPLNLFGNGRGSPEAYDYFWDVSRWATRNKMDSFQATLTGELFKLPGGPLSFAIGGEYRHVSLEQTSNADPRVAIDYTGLRGVLPTQLSRFRLTNNGVAQGSQNVKEAYLELNVPLLKNSAIGTLELSGAGRVTDYSTSGSVKTWKLGGSYEPVEGVRFRGTVSRDIRAPSLFELFAAQQNASQSFADPLTNRNIGVQLVSGGNLNLTPEVANTFTAGVVLKPNFLPNFSFSVDYFDIDVKDAIAAPYTAQQILTLCAQSNYTSPICDFVVRPLGPSNPSPDNIPQQILLYADNLANQRVRGLDFEMAYGLDVGAGRIGVRAFGTYMITFDQTNAAGQPTRHLVGTADFATGVPAQNVPLPRWRGLLDVNYNNGGFTAGVQERLIGSYDRSHEQVYASNRVPAILYTDVNLSYKIPVKFGELEIFGVVNNLFDQKPPLTPSIQAAPGLNPPYYVSAYSIIGRYVTGGVRIKF